MRPFWVSLWVSALSGADLAPHFAGRSGAAILWDLERDQMAGAWNDGRAAEVELRPGSLLKPFTFAAWLESGRYDGAHKVACKEGALDAVEALAYSCNEYFDDVVKRLGTEEMTRGYARFGLDYRRPTLRLGDLLPAYKRLVTRYREARLAPLFLGLRKAVEYGTARYAQGGATAVAGKTGTMRGTALFAGFAPADRPKYLLLIHLDGGSGGGDAAPPAGKIFASLFPELRSAFDPGRVTVEIFWQQRPAQLNLGPGAYAAGTEIVAGASRLRAPGPIRVRKLDGGYSVRASVALEDYVEAVLHGEAGGFRHAAARQAQAVASRTYAARFRGRHAEEGFDFCDTTHCQDARFTLAARPELREAVELTSGELLWRQGKPIEAYYHADSGGWLEEAPPRRDTWWKDEAGARWEWRIAAPALAAALRLNFITQNFRVREREASGRVRSLDVFGHPAEGPAFRTAVGRTLGWEKLPSRLFDVERDGRDLLFRGQGRGHGMGMPQTSAERMAAAGKGYREILAEYYRGAKVAVTASGLTWESRREGKVTLYSTSLAKDVAWLGVAARELARWEKELGMQGEARVRVYPSREAFRDATGIVEQVMGATRGTHVRLMPRAPLATLRHELLHALLEANTRVAHPPWFREGIVEWLNGEDGEHGGRVKELELRYGRAKVIEFWRKGLP